MGQLINLKLDVSKIDKKKLFKGAKGTYLDLTVSVNDETDQFGNNVSAYISQSKEERERRDSRTYLGNGKVAWSSNSQPESRSAESVPDFDGDGAEDDDLPF